MTPISKKRKLEEVDSDKDEQDSPQGRVLSHAAQRRLRKRHKTSATVTDTDNGNSVEKGIGSSDKDNLYSVWVGNLAFKTTPDALREFFATDAEVVKVRMPSKALHGGQVQPYGSQAKNRGYAYVDFKTQEAKEAAIAKSETPLEGRKLLIKDASDFTGRPEKDKVDTQLNPSLGLTKTAKKILSQQKNAPCATLFIGNLGFETKEEEIAYLFGRVHPKIQKKESSTAPPGDNDRLLRVRMGTFEDSGKCKGFAFVDFKEVQYAVDALTNPRNHSLNGRALVVEYASPDAVRRGEIINSKTTAAPRSRASRRPQKSERIAAKLASRNHASAQIDNTHDNNEEEVAPAAISDEKSSEKMSEGQRRKAPKRTIDSTSRLKPGAAFPRAKRESAAIVHSTGTKIVF
ncbi:hypothetical protein FRC15_005389 [Serendipita sp. 397]|nr:hypothetical protein FRC15_005389 [Serendipita sp. 397]